MDNFKQYNFRKVSSAKRDSLYLFLNYEGGDADTNHPDEIPLNIKFSEYKDNLIEIGENYI